MENPWEKTMAYMVYQVDMAHEFPGIFAIFAPGVGWDLGLAQRLRLRTAAEGRATDPGAALGGRKPWRTREVCPMMIQLSHDDPLVNIQKTMENYENIKINYFFGAMFNSKLLNYQRVSMLIHCRVS